MVFLKILRMNMTKKLQDSKNFEIAFLDSDDYEENDFFQPNIYCRGNDESSLEEKTEILWSRERKSFSENDFFLNGCDSFSDLSGRSTSSCSWHNDDFDMKSSTKVSKSLEAVDDALYEKEQSHFISEEVYQECCDWSNKFPYFRLKGEQIIKPFDDSIAFYKQDHKEALSKTFENSSLSLRVEGKKMALHVPDKPCKRSNFEAVPESEQITFFEEIVANDDGHEKCFAFSQSENVNSGTTHSQEHVVDTETITSLNYLRDKVIERLAQHAWPKVLEALQKFQAAQKPYKTDEDFQLPPIVAAHVEQRRCIPIQRPKTEETSLSMNDFPKLSSILSVSPKILQDRKECRSGRSSLRSSRPNSEIHLSRRSNVIASFQSKNNLQKTSGPLRTPNTPREIQFISKKGLKKDEKDNDKVSLYLPALEEDITDPVDYLKGFSLQSESKTISTSVITHFPQKPGCFLPPIDSDNLHPDVKLARNLFTFFGSDLKSSSRREMAQKPKTPASRPNTSTSKRGVKPSENLNYRFINDSFSSISNSNQANIKRIDDNSEKQVTLFPIVTSLVPSREKNVSSTKKSFLNTFSGRKR